MIDNDLVGAGVDDGEVAADIQDSLDVAGDQVLLDARFLLVVHGGQGADDAVGAAEERPSRGDAVAGSEVAEVRHVSAHNEDRIDGGVIDIRRVPRGERKDGVGGGAAADSEVADDKARVEDVDAGVDLRCGDVTEADEVGTDGGAVELGEVAADVQDAVIGRGEWARGAVGVARIEDGEREDRAVEVEDEIRGSGGGRICGGRVWR